MKIGIIGAIDEEVRSLISLFECTSMVNVAGNNFYEGLLFGENCIIVKSGVGKVCASMTAQILISKFNVEKIIFTGLAGAINKSLKIGDIVICKECIQYDLDASELGFKIGQIPYTEHRFFVADNKMMQVALKTKIEDTKIVSGTILTGDLFLNHKTQIKYASLFNELKGDCLEMEGAAVAQVCVLNDIPFCIIRIISDNADENAVDNFEKFKNAVSQKSLRIIEEIIKNERVNKI